MAGGILLLVGAFAKSAQVPLHTWLPDAMEGPTPVSALIHAATMVTAGVYLIARMHPIFEQAPAAADVGAVVGCVTLLIAASIALVVTDLKRVIAYSTMSQIGYMIMAVSSAAYAAGMFHLMTHAFFKALLFMAAGSVIAAMARHPGPRPHGRLPQGDAVHVRLHGRSAASRCRASRRSRASSPRTRSSSLLIDRGGWHVVLAVLGYVGALLTAIYTFRMIFRAFLGEPCPEALELEHGHLYHAPEHTNPATGEVEDTDVGFPGPDHHIAEREWPMKIAMGVLAVLAVVGGVVHIPHVHRAAAQVPRADVRRLARSTRSSSRPATRSSSAWPSARCSALLGIFIAYLLWVKHPERPAAIRARLGGAAPLLRRTSGTSTRRSTSCSCARPPGSAASPPRRSSACSSTARSSAAPSGAVRAASAAVRGIQTGYLRYYAALLLVGLTGLGAYFLISA